MYIIKPVYIWNILCIISYIPFIKGNEDNMKKNKNLLKICFIAFFIIVSVMIVYKVAPPVLHSKNISNFKKKYTSEKEYINKIKFVYYESGLEIQYYVKEVSEKEANQIVDFTKEFVSTQEFLDFFSKRFRKRYKNITKHFSDDYSPPATIIIYDVDQMIPIYKYSSKPPYVNWSSMN